MIILNKFQNNRLKKIKVELDAYIFVKLESVRGDNPAPAMCHKTLDISEDEFDDILETPANGNTGEIPVFSEPSKKLSILKKTNLPKVVSYESIGKTLDEMLESKEQTFSTMLLRLIDERGLKDSEVYKKANIDRRLFSKIRGDVDYVPSKKTAISFCFALKLDMDEAKKLLETAGYALSTSSRFDLIIMYLIENREYNIHFANIVLDDYGEGTLSK